MVGLFPTEVLRRLVLHPPFISSLFFKDLSHHSLQPFWSAPPLTLPTDSPPVDPPVRFLFPPYLLRLNYAKSLLTNPCMELA
jgi:hypothetical protein